MMVPMVVMMSVRAVAAAPTLFGARSSAHSRKNALPFTQSSCAPIAAISA